MSLSQFKQTNLSSNYFRWPEPKTALELPENRSICDMAKHIHLYLVHILELDSSFDFACQLEKCLHFYRSSKNRVEAQIFNLWLGHRTNSHHSIDHAHCCV